MVGRLPRSVAAGLLAVCGGRPAPDGAPVDRTCRGRGRT